MSNQLLLQHPNGDSTRFTRLSDGSVLMVTNCYADDFMAVVKITADQERELFNWLAETRGDK